MRYEGGPQLQVREVGFPGVGFGFGSADVLLALGRRGAAASLEVRWPNGEVARYHGFPAGRLHVIRQDRGRLQAFGSGRDGKRPATIDGDAAAKALRIQPDCNPCRRSVQFTVPETRTGTNSVSLYVYDARGRRVRTLPVVSGIATWDLRASDGSAAAAGVYWVRQAGALSARAVRIVVLR